MSPNADSHSQSTLCVHADDPLNTLPASAEGEITDVAPALHVSTTFRFNKDPEKLVEAKDCDLFTHRDTHIYSRETTPNTTRLEAILSSICGGRALCYSSGLSATFATYTYLKPKKVSIGGGYHGTHGVLSIHHRLTGVTKIPLDCPAEDLSPGDVIHIETPFNPTGEAYDLQYYADKAHSRGAFLVVDSTFGPPGLQDPFKHGADLVMHSGTKYFGGHSDLLCGVLVASPQREDWFKGLWMDRMDLGSVMGNMESWLTVRSLRTLELRVTRQSRNADKIVDWLDKGMNDSFTGDDEEQAASDVSLIKPHVTKLYHASLQARGPANAWLPLQMPNGYGPVFALHLATPEMARRFPSYLELFHHATSLGGVESLVEWRAMSDETIDRRLVRFSIGVEDVEDLIEDIRGALRKLEAWNKEQERGQK